MILSFFCVGGWGLECIKDFCGKTKREATRWTPQLHNGIVHWPHWQCIRHPPTPQPNPGPPHAHLWCTHPLSLFCSAAVLFYLMSRGALDTQKKNIYICMYICTVALNCSYYVYMKKHLFINFRADPLIRFEGALNQGICGAGKGAARNAAFSEE